MGADKGFEGPEVKNIYSHQVMSALVATFSVEPPVCPEVPVCLRVSVCLSGCINYESEDCVPNVKLTLAGSGLLMDLCCKTEAVPHTQTQKE